MQAAKDAVKNFTSKHGQHDTSVHEKVAPAVQNETVTRQQEERVQTALDKEVHQDHYHTSVQPIKDSEVLPEQHHHRMAGVEERSFKHNDDEDTRLRLEKEAAQFKSTQNRVEGQTTTTAVPAAAGEHVHHHVHETIQPVINKQTVEPHVVHTTVPVHEVHHNSAQHHATSALPAVSMDEFKKQGGSLGGRGERMDEFDGCPKHAHDSSGAGTTHSHTGTGAGVAGSQGLNSRDNTTASSNANGQQTKPSLMDKLNPMKDADGDGKKGLMD